MFRFQIILTLYKHCFLFKMAANGNRLGDSGVRRLVETSAFVNPAGQLLLTQRGKTRMGGVGIVFELYIAVL